LDQTEGVTANLYGTPDGLPVGRYQLRILAWVTGHAGCSAIEAVGGDRDRYGSSSYPRPVWALARRGLLLVDRSRPGRYRLYMSEAGFEALMVARHGTDWRERPDAAMAEEQMANIRQEWLRRWEACQLARIPKQPRPRRPGTPTGPARWPDPRARLPAGEAATATGVFGLASTGPRARMTC
jgi:hypothetical protein